VILMSYLHISQSTAQWIVALQLSRGVLLAGHPAVRRGARLLPAAGLHHPDDGADHPAAAQGRGLRPDLARSRKNRAFVRACGTVGTKGR
jgi:hypothetical protein